jgi:hypothetical protein
MLSEEEARNLIIAWGAAKGFSVPFLCIVKLEVNFFQCVAVRANSRYLWFSS